MVRFVLLSLSVLLAGVTAFLPAAPLTTSVRTGARTSNGLTMEYIPDGLSKAQWAALKKKERAPKKNLGAGGTAGMKFRSRSMKEFQLGREAGKLEYNMPMEDAEAKLRKGLIKPEDIPYMQRKGGMPDNSDLKKPGFFDRFKRK